MAYIIKPTVESSITPYSKAMLDDLVEKKEAYLKKNAVEEPIVEEPKEVLEEHEEHEEHEEEVKEDLQTVEEVDVEEAEIRKNSKAKSKKVGGK